jgi:ribosomal protein L34E
MIRNAGRLAGTGGGKMGTVTMRHLEDKRRCPHCGGELHRISYLMERSAEANVLSARAIAWILVALMSFVVIAIAVAS